MDRSPPSVLSSAPFPGWSRWAVGRSLPPRLLLPSATSFPPHPPNNSGRVSLLVCSGVEEPYNALGRGRPRYVPSSSDIVRDKLWERDIFFSLSTVNLCFFLPPPSPSFPFLSPPPSSPPLAVSSPAIPPSVLSRLLPLGAAQCETPRLYLLCSIGVNSTQWCFHQWDTHFPPYS